jgi:hypothetical protein
MKCENTQAIDALLLNSMTLGPFSKISIRNSPMSRYTILVTVGLKQVFVGLRTKHTEPEI